MNSIKASTPGEYLGFFGVGVMGEALLAGIIKAGTASELIYFCEKRDDRALQISEKYGAIRGDLVQIAQLCSTIFLVVKPQDLSELLVSLAPHKRSDALLLSFVAGKSTEFIESNLGQQAAVIRIMPNTAVLIGKGMSALSTGKFATANQLMRAKTLLSASGEVVVVSEDLQSAVTAVSGSGPAYFFAFVEAMVDAGIELGLSKEIATQLTSQTIVGAAAMLAESGKSATTLRENVTSPNGTTAAALKIFDDGKLADLVSKAMRACHDRSQELA